MICLLYDPLDDATNYAHLKKEWDSKIVTMLRLWFRSDRGFPVIMRSDNFENGPRQPDRVSCGVHVLCMAHAHITVDYSFERSMITPEYLHVVRLRTMLTMLKEVKMSMTERDASSQI